MQHHSGAYDVDQNGYQTYNPTAAPDLSGNFQGYQAQNAQASNINGLGGQPYSNAQQGLLAQLQAQAQGVGGPNLAQQALREGQQGNLASALAAQASANSGNQNPGAAQRAIQQNLGAINAGAAGQAGQLAAEQQMGAEQALGQANAQGFGMAAQQAGLNQQAALANQQAQNEQGQFNAQAQENLGQLQNQQSEYGNTLGAALAQQYNQATQAYGLQNNAATNQAENQLFQTGEQALGGGLSGGGSAMMSGAGGSGAGAAAAAGAARGTGGPVSRPTTVTVGEHGPEIAHLAPGSEIVPLDGPDTGAGMKHPIDVSALTSHPDFLKAVHDAVADNPELLKAALTKKTKAKS